MAAPVGLTYQPSGNDSTAWSEDNQIAITTDKCVNIFSLQPNPSESSGTFAFEKMSIKQCADILKFDVGISIKNDGEYNPVLQSTLTDRTLIPQSPKKPNYFECQVDRNGLKMVKWSPTLTDTLDRSLLACLAIDHRLAIFKRNTRKGNFLKIADLSLILNKLLSQQEFAHFNEEQHPKLPAIPDIETTCLEFKRRIYMLAAVTMEWSMVFKGDSESHMEWGTDEERMSCDRDSFLLLAVSMKSGHVVIWKFKLPLDNESDISLYSAFQSGYQWPTSLSWYRPPPLQGTSQALKACTCIAVGGLEGRISLWNQDEESGTTSTPTFHKCLDVWSDKDLIAVSNIAWVHTAPSQDSACTATLVATKGLFILAFLIDLSSMTIVRQTHAPSQHVIPPTSLCVSGSTVLTGSTCGSIHQAVIDWTNSDDVLATDILEPTTPNIKSFGTGLSPNAIYAAFPLMYRWRHNRFFVKKLHFCIVGTMDSVVAELLNPKKNLSEKADLLEYVRQTVVNTGGNLPEELESVADGGVTQVGSEVSEVKSNSYLLRLRRFLLQLQFSHLQGPRKDQDAENWKGERMQKIESDIQLIERELIRSHIVSALQSWQRIAMTTDWKCNNSDTSTDTTALLLMADWLSANTDADEEPIRGLVTKVHGDIPHSIEDGRRESCDLCGGSIALTSASSDACQNGHRWRRCSLSLLLCQTTSTPRVCNHCDAMALPIPDNTDSTWLRGALKQRCIFCEAVFMPP